MTEHTRALANERRLRWSTIITFIMFTVQLIGGYLTHSLAIASDAWHLLSDLFSLILSLYAVKQTMKPADETHTFGYHRFGSLAAFVNGLILIGISVYIMVQATTRFMHPVEVESIGMIYLSAIGFIGTFLIVKVLKAGEDDINVKSSLLHFLGDVFSYFGILIGAVMIKFTGWNIVDPILSLVFAGIILKNAWAITREAALILLEAAPGGVKIETLKKRLLQIPEIEKILDLHIWSLSNEHVSLSAHIQVNNMEVEQSNQLLLQIKTVLAEEFAISHTTIQFQTKGDYINRIPSSNIPFTH
ncbi:MAG TPA: cation diffusion facilitator family transporter [Bacillota bacterium]|nr:cation diffusion facilitator family transporter [Bacillota bacterium]